MLDAVSDDETWFVFLRDAELALDAFEQAIWRRER
jgi:hypothetical protein